MLVWLMWARAQRMRETPDCDAAPSKIVAGAPKSRFHVHRWCKVITVTRYFTFIKNLIIARSKAMITEQSDGGVRGPCKRDTHGTFSDYRTTLWWKLSNSRASSTLTPVSTWADAFSISE